MKANLDLTTIWLLSSVLGLPAFAQGTAFTYQGRLNDGSNLATGIYDLRFTMYDSTNNPGTVIAGPLTNSGTSVSNGLFTVTLDFGGGVFTGAERWLEIGVRTNGVGVFATLSPRQKLTATPYAVTAGGFAGSLPSSQFGGAYGNAVNLYNSANQFQGVFGGDGAALGNLSPSALRMGGVMEIGPARFEEVGVPISEYVNNQHQLAVGDFNGDGWPDVALLGMAFTDSPTRLSVYTNDARNSFALMWEVVTIVGGFGPRAIVAADVNGDGKADLYRANTGVTAAGNSASLYLGGATAMTYFGDLTTGAKPVALFAVDLNNDSRPDLVTANASAATFQVFVNTGNGLPTLSGTYPYPNTGYIPGQFVHFASADLNGDGRRDLVASVTGDWYPQTRVCIFTNAGGVTLTSVANYSPADLGEFYMQITGVKCLDVDSDNIPEIVFTSYDPSGNAAKILKRNPYDIGFTPWKRFPGAAVSLAAADFNFDGRADIVCANKFFNNAGMGNFVLDAILPANIYNGDYVVAADFNRDGRMDLFAAGYSSERLFLNNAGVTTRGTFEVRNNAGGSRFVVDEQGLRLLATNGTAMLAISNSNASFNTPVIFNSGITANGSLNWGSGASLWPDQGGAIELGDSVQNFAFPYIDFHYGVGANQDFNVRLMNDANGQLTLSGNQQITGSLGFGASTRQMLNLWNTSYGIGVQAYTFYQRSDSDFAWFRAGTHSDTANDPGPGGTRLMSLSGAGDLTLRHNLQFNTGSLRQMVELWGGEHAIGVQGWTTYFRTIGAPAFGGFAWYKGGVHNDAQYNSGGGEELMRLDSSGLRVRGAFVSSSDRNAKENFKPVDARAVLAKVASLPISRWNFKQDTDTEHIGPMAQDFHAAFGVGIDDKHIATVDADGVALAAIQGLNQKVEAESQRSEIRSQKSEDKIRNLEVENAELKARMEKLEQIYNQKNGGAK